LSEKQPSWTAETLVAAMRSKVDRSIFLGYRLFKYVNDCLDKEWQYYLSRNNEWRAYTNDQRI
jgi:hypothetical protein